MRQLKIKLAGPEDAPALVEWLNGTKGNLFDPRILEYKTLRTLCSYDGQPIAYLPTQRTLFLESLAVNPAASLMDRAQAFRDLVKGAELLAASDAIRELYMLCADEAVLKIAQGHGFERVPYPLVRMKL
jgi:hypothetical protein